MRVQFVKMSGSGNDFVLVDNRKHTSQIKDRSDFVRKVSDRKTGVGCDGVLFVDDSANCDFTMHYFNADGGEVEFCGNGARCIAHFAHHCLGLGSALMFDSNAGFVSAKVDGDHVEVLMPPASEVLGPKQIDLQDCKLEYFFVNTAVPHVVIFWEDLANAPVFELGTKIRYYDDFRPAGTNVNFMRRIGPSEIEIRTFERGVEDETLACGTGAVACALVSNKVFLDNFPIKVQVALPDLLIIDRPGPRCTLSGFVSRIFSGHMEIE